MRTRALLLTLPLLFAACGAEAPTPESLTDAGIQALNSGKYEAARAEFDRALALIAGDATHPRFKASTLGAIEAEVHLNPEKAEREFQRLRKMHPGQVRDRDYSQVATLLASVRAYPEAIRVLDLGVKSHPDSELIRTHLASIKKEMEESGNMAGLAELEGLGYLGER